MTSTTLLPAPSEAESGFDFRARVDALRCHESASLRSRLADARREQARWRMEELALVRVLDDRAHLREEPSLSFQTQRSVRDVARALESLPAIADAAQSGDISWDQLQPLAQIAKPETDREWARRGRNTAPSTCDGS